MYFLCAQCAKQLRILRTHGIFESGFVGVQTSDRRPDSRQFGDQTGDIGVSAHMAFRHPNSIGRGLAATRPRSFMR